MHLWVGQVEFTGIKAHENVHFVTREGFHLVDLIAKSKSTRPMLHARKLLIFNNDRCVKRSPGMLVEGPANHIDEFRPFGHCDRCTMNADESFTVIMHEREQIGLLL